jgi:hypothetical protein
MYTENSCGCVSPKPELAGIERRTTVAILRDDPLFQGWGPKL